MKKGIFVGFLVAVFCLGLVGFTSAQNATAEWKKSKHANRELAVLDATWENRKEDAAHCGRCHAEQGFKAWLPQLMKGDPTPIKKPDGSKADEAYLTGLGLTKEKIQSPGCTACHSSGAALRIKDNIPMLPNGLSIRAMGKGALCMACHNTRNGRIAWDSPDPKRYSQPHDAAQTDVLLGKNVFFYNDTGDTASPHGVSTGNACVSCHKETAKGGHTFHAQGCSACHGPKMKESFVQSGTVELLKQLSEAIVKKLSPSKEKIACVSSWDEKTDKYAPNTAIEGKNIKSIEIPPGIHGQISLKFVMNDGKVVMAQMGTVKDACGDQGKPVYPTSDPVVRALWNYLLFTYDGSKGVHNPSFSRNVLVATINAMSK